MIRDLSTAHPTTQRTAQSEAAVSFVEFCEHLGARKITEQNGLSSRMRCTVVLCQMSRCPDTKKKEPSQGKKTGGEYLPTENQDN
jgi:hypothetical protein